MSQNYEPIVDKMSMINDWTSKHNVIERFITVAVVLTWTLSSILVLFPVMTNGVFFIPPEFYYQILTGAMLTVAAFQFFGIQFLQMLLDALLKWKQCDKESKDGKSA